MSIGKSQVPADFETCVLCGLGYSDTCQVLKGILVDAIASCEECRRPDPRRTA